MFVLRKAPLRASLFACAALSPAHLHAEELETDPADPFLLETVIVIGERPDLPPEAYKVDPALEGRLATLDDLFRGTPGVILEPVFGGVDHPRFAIRGSGLQRGTQPAGRGVELRLDGLPMTYADTSFDFVEWIDPLTFDDVSVLRGGRGVRAGGTALGGVIDFNGRSGAGAPTALARGEIGSFEFRRAQGALAGGDENLNGYATGTWFSQDGFREHNEQQAWRVYGNGEAVVSDALTVRGSVLWSDSELELPGPQTEAQVEAGSRAAQPFNVAGDWRRFAERLRVAAGATYEFGDYIFDIDAGYMDTDVEFRRRDVQVENNEDWSIVSRLGRVVAFPAGEGDIGVSVVYQHNDRRQQQFLNSGGTPPTFTGERGLQWADNDFGASRLSLLGHMDIPLREAVSLSFSGGWNRHTRMIEENFSTRDVRPAATLDRDYEEVSGLALLSWEVAQNVTLFAGASYVMEPPTYDILLINVAGTPGPMNALVDGDNPRRPRILDIDEQTATTVEAGARGRVGPAAFDVTLYRAWLDGEIVSTSDFVSQTVISAGNADDTLRWGAEASVNIDAGSDVFLDGDALRVGVDWTWTDARFDDDPLFADNQLPIVVEHLFEARLGYDAGFGVIAELFTTVVPDGGFVDYANTVQADGYATLGARVSWDAGPVLVFAEGRNITDERYVSSIITARNNLNGADFPTFAPGEGAAFTIGLQASF